MSVVTRQLPAKVSRRKVINLKQKRSTISEGNPMKPSDIYQKESLSSTAENVKHRHAEDLSDSDYDSDDTHANLMRRRQKIQEKKQALIKKLELHEAAAKLRNSLTPPHRQTARKRTRKNDSLKPPQVRTRKSLRLQNIEAKLDYEASLPPEENEQYRIPTETHRLEPWSNLDTENSDVTLKENSSTTANASNNFCISFSTRVTASKTRVNHLDSNSYSTVVKAMMKHGCKWKKVVDHRIYCITVHERSDILLIAAGSTTGTVGLWKYDGKRNSVYDFSTYDHVVTNVQFSSLSPSSLYFSSRAGAVRAMNLDKGVFEECLLDDDDISVSSFAIQDPSLDILLSGTGNGKIIVCDPRRKRNCKTYNAHDRVIKSVSVHPVHRNIFATSSNDCTVKLFDMRSLSATMKPLSKLTDHYKAIDSAYFSPLTGNKLLTTSLDDHIRLYDTSEASQARFLHSLHHNNWTGRWLSNFKAVWHPSSEDVIAIGSMKQPRQIDVLNSSLGTVDTLTDAENLNSVCSLLTFHPTRHVIVGGNSSGKVFVFEGQTNKSS